MEIHRRFPLVGQFEDLAFLRNPPSGPYWRRAKVVAHASRLIPSSALRITALSNLSRRSAAIRRKCDVPAFVPITSDNSWFIILTDMGQVVARPASKVTAGASATDIGASRHRCSRVESLSALFESEVDHIG